MRFVAIDFETADPKRDSACAVGLARVEDGRIVYRESVLVCPPRGMNPQFTAIHGLTWEAVKDAPPFAAVWAKLAPILVGAERLVAHNVAFDRSVLRACCCVAKIAAPTIPWECTLEMARERWPKPARHKLPDVCGYLGIRFTNHHEAGADAEAAALVYLALTGKGASPASVPATLAPKPAPAPAPAWAPSGPCGEILDEIPAEYRTPAVVRLMCDAERLGPVFARDLVRRLGRFFTREEPGRPRCGCGQPATRYSRLCAECGRVASGDADAARGNADTFPRLMELVSALNRRKSLRLKIDVGTTGRVAVHVQDRRTRQERRVPFRDQQSALAWLNDLAGSA